MSNPATTELDEITQFKITQFSNSSRCQLQFAQLFRTKLKAGDIGVVLLCNAPDQVFDLGGVTSQVARKEIRQLLLAEESADHRLGVGLFLPVAREHHVVYAFVFEAVKLTRDVQCSLHHTVMDEARLLRRCPVYLFTAIPFISKWPPRSSGPDPTNERAGYSLPKYPR